MTIQRTYIYIDGFNLYYRSIKNTPYKWLDLKKFVNCLLDPQHDVKIIKYFTAIVSGKRDPQQPIRQKTYIRAIEKYIPEIQVYYGSFLTHEVYAPLANTKPPQLVKVLKSCEEDGDNNIEYEAPLAIIEPPQLAKIIKSEEKGSDVNIAVHLLNDAWLDKYDCAVVLSNDSDLAEALRLVKEQTNKKIGLITPGIRPARELMKYASFVKRIRKGVLKDSQLPDPIPGTKIRKPDRW